MTKPDWAEVEFVADSSIEAARVRQALVESGVQFVEISAAHYIGPAIKYGGTRYNTLEAMLTVIGALAERHKASSAHQVQGH